MNNKASKQVILSGLFIALGLLLPVLFHTVGAAGPMFLPMHIPVLIGGFILSPMYALLVGMITPLLSSVLTGMPVLMPMAIIMMVELGVYGLSVSLIKRRNVHNIIALIGAMIIGRLAAGLMVFALINVVGIKFAPPVTYLVSAVTTGIPGILIQVICIPTFMVIVGKFVKTSYSH